MNRSNINTIGNVQVSNLGNGESVFAGKTFGNTLNLKTLSVTGDTMTITSDDNNIYFSANTGGGGGTTISGTTNYIPKFNAGGDNIEDTTMTFNNHVLCDSDSLCVRVSNALYLDAPDGTQTGYVYLGAPDTSSSIINQRIATTGLATNLNLVLASKGTGYIFLSAPTTYIGGVGNTGLKWSASSKLLTMGLAARLTAYGGNGATPDGQDFCIVGATPYSQSGYGGSGGGICICGANAASTLGDAVNGGNVIMRGGNPLNGGTVGRIRMSNLPAQTSETNVIYIDGSGNLSSGATSGGDSLGWSNLTNCSTVVGCATRVAGYTMYGNSFFGVGVGSGATGAYNVGVGTQVLSSISNSSNNTGVGYHALCLNNNNIGGNTGIGAYSLDANTGYYNTAVGVSALNGAGNGNNNTAVGASALNDNTTGIGNVALGASALHKNLNGLHNVGIGYRALHNNTSGCFNVAIGCYALYSNTTGQYNVGIGKCTLCENTTGVQNVGVGYGLKNNTSGNCNVAIGWDVLNANTDGDYNIAIGQSALSSNVVGRDNIAIGSGMASNTSGCTNIVIGSQAGNTTTGCQNIIMGDYAGVMIYANSGNVIIGTQAGRQSTGSRNVIIGKTGGLGYNETGSDKLHIGNCSTCSLIMGDFAGKTVTIDNKLCVANLQIPTGAATGCVLTSDASGNATWGGGLDAFAALTSNSNATWDTSGGLNKTWSINGSHTLTLTNVASGMYGTVKVTVTSGTPTITLSGSGITFKGNGSLASLATGTYILAWLASSATTVEWNIASYT